MLSEVNHVQRNWPALIWAVGGASVLAKHALLSVILQGSHRQTISSASELFAKEGPMRKTTLATIATCTLASLLFFLAPVFRQAFRVSLIQWHAIFGTEDHSRLSPELEAVARRAEQNQDAEALAFVAVRHGNASESARLAEEAVHLDRNLIWVYAVVAVKFSSFPEIDGWVPALESFDPQNALPHLIAAEKIDIDLVDRCQIPHRVEENPAAWKDAMAAAFQSQKLNTYFDRLKELDRRTLLRYPADDVSELFDLWSASAIAYGQMKRRTIGGAFQRFPAAVLVEKNNEMESSHRVHRCSVAGGGHSSGFHFSG